MSDTIDWVEKIEQALSDSEDPFDVGRAGETPMTRLADEIARACGASPVEGFHITKAFIEVATTGMEMFPEPSGKRLKYAGQLTYLAQYVPPFTTLLFRSIVHR